MDYLPLLTAYRDQLALLNHAMASIDSENWMVDVLDYKTYMVPSNSETSCLAHEELRYYAAVV